MSNIRLSRVLGAATAAYSVGIIASPRLLTRPVGLAAGEPWPSMAALVQSIGVRDAAIGTVAALCPAGPVLRTALLLRVAADFGDAAVFGRVLEGGTRAKVAGFAAGWGLLNALALAQEWRNR